VRIVVATRNHGKLAELRALGEVQDLSIRWESLDQHPGVPEVEEDAPTFLGNARKKALAVSKATGLAALADDSGLCVDALDGAPGVLSARYAPGTDADRVQHLLRVLAAVPPERRGAHFACALSLVIPGREPIEVEGRCEGHITAAPRGTHGFGYDPVFQMASGQTLAELDRAAKSALSHRAHAFAAMVPHLRVLAGSPP
jgi:XTP/dITP diphosphohydrolase